MSVGLGVIWPALATGLIVLCLSCAWAISSAGFNGELVNDKV